MKKSTPNWALLAAMAVVCVFLFQFPSLFTSLEAFNTPLDIEPIQEGYRDAQRHGTAAWWFDTWIHNGIKFFRPISSYVYYFQCYLLESSGVAATTIFTMLLWAALCVAVGVLAFLLTARPMSSYAATLGASMLYFGMDGTFFHPRWLAYFPVADNILCVTFQILALCCLMVYLRRGGSTPVLGMWAGVVLSCFSKEQGYVTPLMLMAIVLFLPGEFKYRPVAMFHAVAQLFGAVMIYNYGRFVIGADVPTYASEFWNSDLSIAELWKVVFAATIIVFPLFCLSRSAWLNTPKRRMGTLAAFLACCLLSVLASPRVGMEPGVYGLLIIHQSAVELFITVLLCIALYLGYKYWAQVFRLRSYWVAALSVIAITFIPLASVGAPMNGPRVIFVMPFILIFLSHLIPQMAGIKARISPPDTLPRLPGQYPPEMNRS